MTTGPGPWIVGQGFPDTVATVFEAGTTIINGQGVFVYSGVPARGTLILSIAGAAGTDQFGNIYGQGLNVGVWSAVTGAQEQHFGIDDNGRLYLADSAGNTTIFFDPQDEFMGVYNPGTGAGNLIASVAAAAGTDASGNAYTQGITAYSVITGVFAGTYAVELANQTQVWGAAVAALIFTNLTSAARLPPAVTGQAHATAGANLNLQSGVSTAGASGSTIQVQDSVSSGIAGGLVDVITGALWVLAADGNTYDTERLSLINTAGNQTISSNADVPVTSLSAVVGIGTYRVRGKITWTQNAVNAVTQAMGLTGPAASHVRIPNNHFLNGSGSSSGCSILGALSGGQSTPAFAAGSVIYWEFDGVVTFTAAGTVSVVAHCNGASTFVVESYSFMDLMPVTA